MCFHEGTIYFGFLNGVGLLDLKQDAVRALTGIENVQGGHTDGTLAEARFTQPHILVSTQAGLVVADGTWLRLIDLQKGTVTTLAGSGELKSQDGLGLQASFDEILSV